VSIRIVAGTATGPTPLAAYDAALADAGVHNYNLVRLSSVIPADATIERVGTAGDLGPPGERLSVVEASADATGLATVSAALAWARADSGPGVFYEAGDTTDVATLTERVRDGIAAGMELREWTFAGDVETRTATLDVPTDACGAAVVLGVYGDSDPIL
jgi:arginine decarboxylase